MKIGIIGGGQLARMMVPPAHRLGIEVWVLEKVDGCPAKLAGALQVVGDWSDPQATRRFAKMVDLVTLDHEFASLDALRAVEEHATLLPGSATMELIADKYDQKMTLHEAGIPTVESLPIQSIEDVEEAAERFGWPLMLKARRGGYDGKGNILAEDLEEARAAFGQMGDDLYAEKHLDFEQEVAVMVVRGQDGQSRTYPVVDTVQENHVCRLVRFPSQAPAELCFKARETAERAAQAVNAVGVMGVEMFITREGQVLVNELAPRPHNSGHYTLDACLTSQFENHVRAVAGLPLGDTRAVVEQAVMFNILGDAHGPTKPHGMDQVLNEPGARLHLYGKLSRPGRKVGHLTLVGSDGDELELSGEKLVNQLTFCRKASAV